MPAVRRQPTTAPDARGRETSVDPAVEQVLDAALAQFEDLGVRRSTIEDIARRAGIDRVTVYRRVGSKDDVVQAVIARDARRLIDRVTTSVASLPTLEERVGSAFAMTIQYFRSNLLFNRILALEADTVLPRLTTLAGPLLATGCAAVVQLIQQARRDGLIPTTVDAEGSAEIIVRIVHSFALTPHASLSLRTTAELKAFARTYLAPIVTCSSKPPQHTR